MKFQLSSRKVVRLVITAIGVVTLIVLLLMVLNEKNIHDKVTDMIVMLVGMIALVMAVLTEAELERHTRRSLQIHQEVLAALAEIREINHDNDKIRQLISKDYQVDKQIANRLAHLTEQADASKKATRNKE